MPKEWNDWTDFMKGDVGQPADSRSQPVTPGTVLKKGEIPVPPSDAEVRNYILKGAPKQPTDEQMFGGGVVTDEMVKSAKEEWETRFTRFFKTQHEKLEKNQAPEWGKRGPVNQNDPSQLTEEEKHILSIPVNPNSYK